jgi:hypothetical protein
MEEVDKEISEMKLSLNARARVVAESYLTAVCASQLTFALALIDMHLRLVHIMMLWSPRPMSMGEATVVARQTLLYRMSECKLGNI